MHLIPDLVNNTRTDMMVISSFLVGAAQVASEIEPMMATARKIGIEYLGPR